ncbi:hypothetical protein K1719_017562 [Acacia pycnantha]|nr:hypothetical protein K1719_017562 [Acacia pycnantha]
MISGDIVVHFHHPRRRRELSEPTQLTQEAPTQTQSSQPRPSSDPTGSRTHQKNEVQIINTPAFIHIKVITISDIGNNQYTHHKHGKSLPSTAIL